MPSREAPANSQPSISQIRSNLAILGYVLKRVIPAAFLILFNPLSMKNSSDMRDADAVNLVYAPSYGTPLADGTINKGQDAIAVVLFDDAYLEATDSKWPVSPGVYRGLLRRLVGAGAIGIYIDIRFQGGTDERDAAIDDLFEAARDLELREAAAHRDIRIVFGGNLKAPIPPYGQHLDPPIHTALLEIPGSRQFYSLKQSFEPLAGGGYRHLESPDHASVSTELLEVNTAAYEMYQVWCAHQQDCRLPDAVSAQDKISLQWGYAPDVEMAQYYQRSNGQTCQPFAADWYSRMRNTALFMWGRVFQQDAQATHNASCLYHRNFSVQYINQLDAGGLQELVKDKIVFIGGAISESPDETFSPIQLYVPGVFRHAMALDNLIEAAGSPWLWVERDWLKWMEIILLALVSYSHIVFQRRLRTMASEKNRVQLHALYEVTLLQFLLLVCGVNIAVFHLGPTNWVSYLLMFASVGELWFAMWVYATIREFWNSRIFTGRFRTVWEFWSLRVFTARFSGGESTMRDSMVHAISTLSIVASMALVVVVLLNYLLLAVDGEQPFVAATTLLAAGMCVSLYFMLTKLEAAKTRTPLGWSRRNLQKAKRGYMRRGRYSRFRANSGISPDKAN